MGPILVKQPFTCQGVDIVCVLMQASLAIQLHGLRDLDASLASCIACALRVNPDTTSPAGDVERSGRACKLRLGANQLRGKSKLMRSIVQPLVEIGGGDADRI